MTLTEDFNETKDRKDKESKQMYTYTDIKMKNFNLWMAVDTWYVPTLLINVIKNSWGRVAV